MEERLIECEKRIAHLENQCEELNEIITDQHQIIEELKKQVQILEQKIASESPVRDQKDEEPPPHY